VAGDLSQVLRLIIDGDAKGAISALLGVEKESKRSFAQLGEKMSSIGSTMTKSVTLPIVGGLALAGKAAADEEQEMAVLAQTLRNTAGATKESVDATEEWITAQQNATGIADGDLRPALANLARASKDTSKAQDLLKTAMDTSVATGKPLEQVSLALAKAYNGNIGALGRLGIATKDANGKTLSFDAVLQNLTATMGGSAAAAADTTAGKMAILRARFSDITENIGSAVLPLIEKHLVPAIEKLVRWFESLSEGQRAFLVKAALFAAAAGPAMKMVGTLMQMGSAASRAAKLLRGLGGVATGEAGPAIGRLKGPLSRVVTAMRNTGSGAGSLARMLGKGGALGIALAFTTTMVFKAVDAWKQYREAAKQAEEAYQGAKSNYEVQRAAAEKKYGKNSAKYKKWLALNASAKADIEKDQYKKPWWLPFAKGGDFITNGPTPILAGEAGRERVTITPLGKSGGGSPVYLTIPVYMQGAVIGKADEIGEAVGKLVVPHLRKLARAGAF
jgi:hypothetical protein